MEYRPSLDGIRGVAVLLVLVFHANSRFLHGGFVGVDVFFVLSGFRITSILVHEFDRYPSIDLRNFYARRFRRLIPCLWLVVGLFIAYSLFVDVGEPVAESALFSLTYLTNWARAFDWHHTRWLGHTWSLGIEEQFYVAWPLVALALFKCLPSARGRATALATLFAVFVVYRWCMVDRWTVERIYNGLDTRADSLIAGSALSMMSFSGITAPARWAGAVGVAGLTWFAGWSDWQDPFMHRWGFAICALLSALVIWECAGDGPSLVRGALSLRPLVLTGKISYGVYILHYPVFRAIRTAGISPGSWKVPAIGLPVTSLFAIASFYLIERRFLAAKARFVRAPPAP